MKRAHPLPQKLSTWLEQSAPVPLRAPLAAAIALAQPVLASTPAAEALAVERLEVLAGLKVDPTTAQCALLSPLIEQGQLAPAALDGLAPGLKPLVEGHREALKVWELYAHKPEKAGAESIRRLLLVLIRDLRVVFVLIAEQLVRMRHLAGEPEPQRKAVAQLAADIHAPLANRLGIWQVKWELEDLAFRFLQPAAYKKVASQLDERRDDRERYIRKVISELGMALKSAGIEAEVAGRPKHIFSIWKKMSRKRVELDEVFDVRAVRVMVKDIPGCYAALGVVHAQWPYIPKEFDDYIAHPKGNNYRSLHTAVIGPEGKAVEVQIRTPEMHEHAELGVAAHWRYKEGGGADAEFEKKINHLRDLLGSRDDPAGDGGDEELLRGFSTEVFDDRVYVLTPRGQVVDMQKGATVLDFAYQVHTQVGHRCRGAKVNGRIVPLTHQPGTGDRVEILTAKEDQPKRDWLNPALGYLNSSRSRGKVRAWFNQFDFAQNARDGREILEREFKRTALVEADLEALLPRFELKNLDELYVEVALGDITPGNVLRLVSEQHAARQPPPAVHTTSRENAKVKPPPKDTIVIEGIGGLLWQIAQCCRPLPGDAIVGYITKGRGVSVHRQDCLSLKTLIQREPARMLDVQWGAKGAQKFAVKLKVTAFDRNGLLRDITGILAAEDLSGLAVTTQTRGGEALMDFTVEVRDYAQLSQVLGKIAGVPNVYDVRRSG